MYDYNEVHVVHHPVFIMHLSASERRWQNNKFTNILKYVIVDNITEMASSILLSVHLGPFEKSRLLHTYQELGKRVKVM